MNYEARKAAFVALATTEAEAVQLGEAFDAMNGPTLRTYPRQVADVEWTDRGTRARIAR